MQLKDIEYIRTIAEGGELFCRCRQMLHKPAGPQPGGKTVGTGVGRKPCLREVRIP